MARKRKKKGDPLGQWHEAFGAEKDPAGGEDSPPAAPSEKAVPEKGAVPAGDAPPPTKRDEVEGEGDGGGEEFVEAPPGREPYWQEEPPSAGGEEEPPISQWEESLHEVTREEEESEGVPEEEEDEFAWPTVKDVEGGGPADEEGTHGGGIPAEGPAPKWTASEEGERMETPSGNAPQGGHGELQSIQKTLESAMGDLADLRKNRGSAVSGGLRQAGEMLDAQHRRVMDLLRNNENLTREARLVQTSVDKRREAKVELETQIEELKGLVDQLSLAGDRLSEERANLTEQKQRAGSDNERMKGEVQSLRESIERLTNERVDLDTETADLEKKRDHLEEDVRRLTKLKEEYLANLARFREDS